MSGKSKKLYILLIFTINIFLGIVVGYAFYYREKKQGIDYKVSSREPSTKKFLDKTDNLVTTSLSLQQAYNRIAKKNMPAIASLHVTTIVVNRSRQPFFEDDFFRRFFGLPDEPTSRYGQSYGTAFVISKDGYLISNHHVIENSEKIVVVFEDSNKEYEAKVIGSDKDSDVALLKITSSDNFPYVILGNSDVLQVGDLVVAIGNPFGLSHTFTTGVVSAKGRNAIGQNRYENFIQTDVAINPGNSGGPLINIFGEVVGINSMIYSQSGGSIGIGFAIPINMAKNIVDQLKKRGRVERGYLGVSVQNVTSQMADDLDIEPKGVYIPEVFENSPAKKGGIKAGDIILKIDGKNVKDANMLRNQIASLGAGKKVTILILRGQKNKELIVTISSQEKQAVTNYNNGISKRYLGLVVGDMGHDFLKQNGIQEPFGVVVKKVERDSPFASKGVRPGDVVRMIAWKEIVNIADFDRVIDEVKNSRKIIFHIQRGTYLQIVVVYP